MHIHTPTAQHPTEDATNDLREDFKKVSSTVKELISVIENKSKDMRDRATQVSNPAKPTKTVDVVMPMHLHGLLNDAELKQLGKCNAN